MPRKFQNGDLVFAKSHRLRGMSIHHYGVVLDYCSSSRYYSVGLLKPFAVFRTYEYDTSLRNYRSDSRPIRCPLRSNELTKAENFTWDGTIPDPNYDQLVARLKISKDRALSSLLSDLVVRSNGDGLGCALTGARKRASIADFRLADRSSRFINLNLEV